jgi:GT2 family glycosyltransferase
MTVPHPIDEKLRSNYQKYAAKNPLFALDHEWLRYNDPALVLAAGDDPEFDYLEYYLARQKSLVSPNPFFDWKVYDTRSSWLGRGGRSPIEYDFMTIGVERNVSPHWIFRNEYLAVMRPGQAHVAFTDEELAAFRANYGSDYLAWLLNVDAFDRASPLFSFGFYRHRTDAQLSNREAMRRYLMGGHVEGVHGTPLFDDDWYLSRYDGELSVGTEPYHKHRSAIQHFLDEGVRKGFSPIPDLDAEFYAKANPGVAKQIGPGKFACPIHHFLGNLATPDLRPNPYFDPVFYLDENPDARKEMEAWGLINPLEHFLHVGYARGWKASRPLVQVSVPEDSAKAVFERRAGLTVHQHLMTGRKPAFVATGASFSAVIPVCNHFEFTVALLLQLARDHGPGSDHPVQPIVVDNGSTDRSPSLPGLFDNLVYLREEAPLGYTAASNLGARSATAPILIFLNNDIELGSRALDTLIEALDDDPTLGATGPKIVLTDGKVQEAGGVVFANGGTAGFGRGLDPDRDVVNLARDVDYVSGCALAVRRALFEELGGFDELFSPGYFEDTDLCLRIWQIGKRVKYLPQAHITHYEYGTYSKGRPKEISYFRMYANKSKFLRKHREALPAIAAPAEPFDLSRAAFRRGRDPGRYVVFVEDLLPNARFGSGFVRSSDVVREFLNRGWRVTAWAGAQRPGDEAFITEHKGRVDVRYMKDTPIPELLKEVGGAVDLVWVCRTHNIANFRSELSEWRRGGPARRLVADTEALASLRNAFPGMSPSQIAQDPRATKVVKGELAAAAGFDRIVCANQSEAQLASAALETDAVSVLGHRFDIVSDPPGFATRRHFVFCGAVHELSSPNLDSLRWLARDILPRIREEIPEAILSFVGYLRGNLVLPTEITEAVSVLGGVDDLKPVFDAHRVFVAPTRLAAGVPHKVQQAMALGVPCVITDNLADQLEVAGQGTPFLTAGMDPDSFAARCVELHANADLWARVQADARAEIERSASPASFGRQFDDILEALDARAEVQS